MIGGHGLAGEGVRARARAREFLQGVAVLVFKHLVLQKVRHARGRIVAPALAGERGVHRAEIGSQDGEGFAEALLRQIADAQAVVQRARFHALAQGGILLAHCAAPFIKYTMSSVVACAAATTCPSVTASVCWMRSSGAVSVPAAAWPSQ